MIMTRRFLSVVAVAGWLAARASSKTQTGATSPVELTAMEFPTIEVQGFVPYYKDTKKNALAINAAQYKDTFAAAQTVYRGPGGRYRLKLVTMTESDGESTYRVRINGQEVAAVQNPKGKDNAAHEHALAEAALNPGDLVQVESNTHSNGAVPEGTGFGYARGRWKALVLSPVTP